MTALAPDPTDTSGNTIYLGAAQGGVWKTTDGGSTWTPLLDNPVQPNGVPLDKFTIAIGSITVTSSGTVYVGTGEPNASTDSFYGAGILKSTDGGQTWTQLGLNTFWKKSIFNVIVNPSDPTKILVAATGRPTPPVQSGLWRSTDGGATWSDIGASLPSISRSASFTSLVNDPSNASIVYAAGGGKIFKSTDAGATWTLSTQSSTGGCFATAGSCSRIALAIAASSPSTVVAAAGDGTLWRTNDSGATWTLVNSPSGGVPFPVTNFCNEAVGSQCTYDIVVAVDPTDPNIIFLGGQDLWVTFDGGISWADEGGYDGNSLAGGNIHSDQHAVAFSPADHQKIFVGNDGGIWTARWHPRQIGGPIFPWVDLNVGLSITQFYSLAADPKELSSFFGGTQDVGIVEHNAITTSGHALSATIWTDTNPGDAGWTGYDTFDPTTQYAGFVGFSGGACAGGFSGGTCLLRRDSGIHCCFNLNGWFGVLQTSGFGRFPLVGAIDPSTPTTLYFPDLSTQTKLLKTTDRGDNWAPTGLDLTTACGGNNCGGTISAVAVAGSNEAFVYAGTTSGRLFASTDGGTSFHERDSGSLPGAQLEHIAVDPSDPNVVFAVFNWFSGNVGQHVFASRHAGDFSTTPSWTDISAGLPDFPVHSVVTDPTGNGAIYVGTDTGVYISTDFGSTWQVLGTGLPRVQVTDLVFAAGSVALVAATHGRGVWTISHLPKHPLTYVATYTQTIGATAQSVEADCYPGDFATGGGFEIPGGVLKEPVASQPNVTSGEPTGWIARFGVGLGGSAKVFADCMAPTSVGGSVPSSYAVEMDRTIKCTRIVVCVGSPAGGVTAPCNGSDPATGGGFETGGLKFVRQSRPNPTSGTPTGWTAFFGISADLGDVLVKAFVVCLSGSGFSTSVASAAGPFGTGPHGISVSCPAGDASVGGGFSFTGGTQVPLISKPDVPSGVASGWIAFFGAGTGGTGTVFAVCLTSGTSTAVTCTPASVLVGVPTACSATISNLDPSSSVTPTGPVSFTSDKAGSFTPSQSCTLSGSGASASCPVQFTPSAGSVGVVSITATYNGDSNHAGSTGIFSLDVFDFTVSVTPSDATVLRGSPTTYSVTTSVVPGSVGAPALVGLAVSGLPADASFAPSSIALPGAATLTIQTGTSSLGDFALTISGSVQGGSRSATANLHLYDFTVTASPSSLQVLTTGSNAYSVSVQLVPGSTTVGLPAIALAVDGLPSGATGTFGPASGTPDFTSTLTITTAHVASGTYALTVSGTDGRSPEGGTRVTHPTLVVLTPQQALQLVINQINDLHSRGVLNEGQANSLIVKLTHAIDQLNTRPDKQTACNELSAFVHEVNAFVSAGILTPAQANALLGPPLGALAIMAAIPC